MMEEKEDTLMYIAELIDAFRVVPRIILVVYAWLVWYVVNWYMLLDSPSTEQTFLVSTISGLSTVIIGLYQNSGRNWVEYRRIMNESKHKQPNVNYITPFSNRKNK